MPLDFSVFDTEVTPESVKAEMLRRMTAAGLQADTREGSYTDLLLSESAYQYYKAWAMYKVALAAGIPSEDSGPYLDGFAKAYGMVRSAAASARVMLCFTGESGTVISAGTVALTAGGLRYRTDLADTISGGEALVPATAEAPGAVYNVEAGTVTRLWTSLVGVTAVTNPQAAEGGADAESDAAFYKRIHTRFSQPVASGNVYYYQQLALEISGVGQAKTIPLWDGPGTVKVVVASEDKQPLDGSVVAQVQQHMDDQRVIGADVTAVSAQALEITVSASCTLDSGVLPEAVEAELADRLRDYFAGLDFGTSEAVRYNQVALRLLSCDGVVDYAGLTLNGAGGNVAKTAEQVPVLGTVTIMAG